MKANREYELIVRRGGRGPAALASPDRVDQVEIVEVATGEVALFWDTAPAQTRRLARAAGVRDVPAVVVGDRVFHGDDGLEAAAAALAPAQA